MRIYGKPGEVSWFSEHSGSLAAPQPSKLNTLVEFPECSDLSVVQSHQLKSAHTKGLFVFT